MKLYLAKEFRDAGYEVIDFGDSDPNLEDDVNMICLGGLVVGHALDWELVEIFLATEFSGGERHRHRRRLAKVADLESSETR